MLPRLRSDAALDGRGLSPLAMCVARVADGSRKVDAIRDLCARELQMPLTMEDVFSALDTLGDHDLLTERVAPPAGPGSINRRFLLRGALTGAGVVAATVVAAGSAAAATTLGDSGSEQQEKKKAAAEEKHKQNHAAAEQRQKANEEEKLKGSQ